MVLQELLSFFNVVKEVFSQPVVKTLFYSIIAILAGLVIVVIIDSQLRRLTERNVLSPAASDKIRRIVNVFYLLFVLLVVLYIATSSNILLVIVLIGFAVSLAASWRVIENIVDHYAIVLSRHVSQGENIEINGVRGRIKSINLLNTVIRTDEGSIMIIPNSLLISKPVRHVGMERTIEIRLTLSISSPGDLNDIEEKIDTVIATRFKHAPRTGEYVLSVESIDSSNVTYRLRTQYLGVEKREAIASSLTRYLYEGLVEYEPRIEVIKAG